jgi:hypothetical protein
VGGLALLFVVGLYLAIGVWIVVKSPGWWRLVALLAMILIPTADALWGRYVTLPRLCKDAGLKVFAKASSADGLMLSTADEYWLTKHGFPFVEGVDGAGRVYRRTLVNGQPVLEQDVRPKARYAVKMTVVDADGLYPGARIELTERPSGELVARLAGFAFRGGWAERMLASFSDSGSANVKRCEVGLLSSERVVVAAFGLKE